MRDTSTVFIIEEDEAHGRALSLACRAAGMAVEVRRSMSDLLRRYRPDAGACMLLDFRGDDPRPLAIQEELLTAGITAPVIGVSSHAAPSLVIRSLRLGTAAFLEHPVDPGELADCVRTAVARHLRKEHRREQRRTVVSRCGQLTPGEREVMHLVLEGLLNKQIAIRLDVTERTVENRRARVMQKMGATSISHLARMTLSCEEDPCKRCPGQNHSAEGITLRAF